MKKVFNISTKSSETDTNKPSKKRKVFKTLGFSSLALLMGAAGVFAFAPLGNAPMSPNTLNANATTQGQTFDLGLDPQNDPVVYTTESGLEIKKSNGKHTSAITVTTNKNKTYTQDLTSFYYFTMGKFSGTIYVGDTTTNTYTVSNEPVNWLIIGRGPGFNFEKSTPAGTSLVNDRDKQEISTSALTLPNFFTTVPEHSDIPEGCMLVLSEKILGQYYFNTTGIVNNSVNTSYYDINYVQGTGSYGNRYRYMGDLNTSTSGAQKYTKKTDGALYTHINNMFSKSTSGTILKNGLGFTTEQASLIIPQQLYTYYSNGGNDDLAETPSTDGGTYYTMFPLACRTTHASTYQNFCVEDYFPTVTQAVAVLIGSNQPFGWHTRTGRRDANFGVARMTAHGDSNYYVNVNANIGVRPAMVMRLA